MGMFDTFNVRRNGRVHQIQSKQFSNSLDCYELGDFVRFDHQPINGVFSIIETHRDDWQDSDSTLYWCAIIIAEGCFIDAFMADSEQEAASAATILVKQWSEPERLASALITYARAHYQAAQTHSCLNHEIAGLLNAYSRWKQGEKPRFLSVMHSADIADFENNAFDLALARLLCREPQLADLVPEQYQVALKRQEGATE